MVAGGRVWQLDDRAFYRGEPVVIVKLTGTRFCDLKTNTGKVYKHARAEDLRTESRRTQPVAADPPLGDLDLSGVSEAMDTPVGPEPAGDLANEADEEPAAVEPSMKRKYREGTMAYRKSKLMLRVEATEKEPLESLLPPMLAEHGLTATATRLGVDKATLGYWLLKMGIKVRRVVLSPGELLEVRRAPAEAD